METCSRQASATCAAAGCIAAHDRPTRGTARWFRRGLVLGALVGGLWLAGASAHAAGAESTHQRNQEAGSAAVHPAPHRLVQASAGKVLAPPRKVTATPEKTSASLAKPQARGQHRTPGAVRSLQNEVGTALVQVGSAQSGVRTKLSNVGTALGDVRTVVRAVPRTVRQVVGAPAALLLPRAIEALAAPRDSSQSPGHDAVAGTPASTLHQLTAGRIAQPSEVQPEQSASSTSQGTNRWRVATNLDSTTAPNRGQPAQPPAGRHGGDFGPLTGNSAASQNDGPSLSVLPAQLLRTEQEGATLKATSPDPRPPHEWASSPAASPD
jgi:hypothetical protein